MTKKTRAKSAPKKTHVKRDLTKKKYTSVEIQALRNAYDKPLERKDYVKYAAAPAILFSGIIFYLTYDLVLGVIFFLIGVFYGLKIWLPKAVRRTYIIKSFNERNRFLNLITQQMSDRSKIPKQILERVVSRLEGELKDDFFPITARIANGATTKEISEMFNGLQEKYQEDVIFSQYLEQVETNFTTGIDNLSSLQDMNGYHTELRKERDKFLTFKSKRIKDNVSLIVLSFVLITALQFATGNNAMYMTAFASTVIGKVVSVIYTLVAVLITHKFQKVYFDDNIMEA